MSGVLPETGRTENLQQRMSKQASSHVNKFAYLCVSNRNSASEKWSKQAIALTSHICSTRETAASAWHGGIEYFIMANDRFINSNLSAIKSQPPSRLSTWRADRTNERTNNAPIIGRRRAEEEEGGERIRDSWRRRRPNLRAKRINDGRIEDRGRRIPTLLAGGRAR